jgi:hypothetical protein
MRDDSWFMGNTVIYRTAYLRDQGGFPEALAAFADGFMCRLLALKYGACFSPDILGSWRKLEGGMASSLSANLARTSAYMAAAESKMLVPGSPFPVDYVNRWKGRQQFAIRRQAFARTIGKGPANRAIQFWRRSRENAYAAWLALRWRPWDIANYIWSTVRR